MALAPALPACARSGDGEWRDKTPGDDACCAPGRIDSSASAFTFPAGEGAGVATFEIDLDLLESTRERMPMAAHRRYDVYGDGPHAAHGAAAAAAAGQGGAGAGADSAGSGSEGRRRWPVAIAAAAAALFALAMNRG